VTALGEPIEIGGESAVVASAYETGLLESLARPAPPDEHAARLGLNAEAVALVLEGLASLGFARREDGRFGASPALEAAMGDPAHPSLPTDAVWSHLPHFLRTGEPHAHMDGSLGERGEAYSEVVARLGRLFEEAARELAAKLPPPGERILDLGAGSGVWSLAMCERSATTRVTAVDLPGVIPAFRARAERLGVGERVEVLPGDFHSVELPARGFERVVLANVLHLEAPDRAQSLIERAAGAIAPGGELIVVDALGERSPAEQRARALYALHLSMRTREGRVHPRAEIERWCRQAGLAGGELVRPGVPPRMVAALVYRG
jgi:SAM-dependent methyltransferase